MLQSKLADLARRRVDVEFQKLHEDLQQDIRQILSEAATREMSTSGPTFANIQRRCVEEIEKRAEIVWQVFVRVINSAGLSPSESPAELIPLAID